MKKILSTTLIMVMILIAIIFSKVDSSYESLDSTGNTLSFENSIKSSSTPKKNYSVHITPTSTRTTNPNEDILQVIQGLISMAEFKYIKAGWLYCSSVSHEYNVVQKTLPDGSQVPQQSTSNSWYLLDDAGKVIQAIEYQNTGDSHTSQLVLYQNGMWKNITLGTKQYQNNYPLKLDGGLIESVSKMEKNETITMEFTSLNGAKVVLLTRNFYTPKPTENIANDVRPYIGNGVKQYIDQATGLVTQIEYYRIKADSTLEMFSMISDFKCETQPNSLSIYFYPPD